MDRFEAMRVFTRVVERCSFTQAAQDVGIPRSTVTDAVKQLENRLGVRLLHRTTRHVSPTLDGEAYYRRCLRILADMEEAEGAFAGATPGGPLRIDVQGALARHFVLPHLPAFLNRYPGIDLLMSEGDRLVDLIHEGVDCVLRVGALLDSDMIARRIALLEEVTLAAPAYIATHGIPRSLDDLPGGHRMVGFKSSASGALLPLAFRHEGEIRRITLPSALSVTAAESYVAAARLGLGLIQIPRYHAETLLRSGAMSSILDDAPPPPIPVSLLYPRDRQLSPRVRVFIDWVTGVFADQTEAPPLPGKVPP